MNKLRNVIVKEGRVSSSSIKVVDHDNAGLSTEFGNTSSFEKRDISLSASNQTSSIRAASKIQISGSVAGSNFSNSGTLQSNSTTPTTLISANLNQLEDNAPRGLPADSWQDSNIGQGPGGGFSHTDAHSNSISAVDISNFGPEAHIITRSTMKGEAVLRRNMPASDLSGTCTNTYPNSKVWGCYVVVTNSVTGYITITAHLDYTDAISRYSSFGIAKAVNNRSEIGMMGNTGYSTNPHVHYEIRKGAPGTTGFYDGVPYLGTTQSEQRTKMSGLTGLSIEQLSR